MEGRKNVCSILTAVVLPQQCIFFRDERVSQYKDLGLATVTIGYDGDKKKIGMFINPSYEGKEIESDQWGLLPYKYLSIVLNGPVLDSSDEDGDNEQPGLFSSIVIILKIF
jgi:hypothetical protein